MIVGTPDLSWSVELVRLRLAGPPDPADLAATLGLVGDGTYLVVRRYGRTVRWCRNVAEVEATGCPFADLDDVPAALPAPRVDPFVVARRRRRQVGGFG